MLRISRQAVREIAHDAERVGYLELHSNPQDRRILQLRLTPCGSAVLRATQAREAAWVIALLNGLGTREIEATAHVLRVLERRLFRAERARHAGEAERRRDGPAR